MSRHNRRKHFVNETMADNFELPQSNQKICKVVASRGNNLHEVESSDSPETFLVSMPNKFRKTIWIKKRDFILVEPIVEGDKVKAEIIKILSPDHVKEFTKHGVWPKKFITKCSLSERREDVNDVYSFVNTNRRIIADEDDDDSDSYSTSTKEE
jgi:probable RNA-binding protein EIF1AD